MATAIQMAKIAIDTDFLKRVEYYMMRTALTVAARTNPVPDNEDLSLINAVLHGNESARLWSIAACTNTTIASGTRAGDGSDITDNDLEWQIGQQWAAFKHV